MMHRVIPQFIKNVYNCTGSRVYIFVILSLIYVLFIQGLGNITLWDPDEPRQAIIAREMIQRNDYIHTHLNGEPNLWKPPFYSWMIVLVSRVTGSVNELAARIPSAIAAGLLALLTFFLGSRLLDPWAGFLSSMVLLTNYQFLSNARESVMDMTFAFFIGLSMFISYFAIKKQNRLLLIFSFIPVSLAILTKGPAGLLISGGIIFIYSLITKNFKRFILPFIIGGLLSAALAMIWFILAGGEYFNEIVVKQSFVRYVNAFDHHENAFYYFKKLFLNFLPWSILLPFSIYHAFKKKYWLPLAWFFFIFLFYEVSTSKRAIYLLSLYPAAALLCGLYLRDKWSSIVVESKTSAVLKVFSFIFIALPLGAVSVFLASPNGTAWLFPINWVVYVYLTLIVVTGVAFAYSLVRRCEKGSLEFLLAYFVLLGIIYTNVYLPFMDKAFKSPKLITNSLVNVLDRKNIFLYGEDSAGLIFYIGRPIKIIVNIQDLRRSAKPDSVLIIKDDKITEVASELELHYVVNTTANYEKDAYSIYLGRDSGKINTPVQQFRPHY